MTLITNFRLRAGGKPPTWVPARGTHRVEFPTVVVIRFFISHCESFEKKTKTTDANFKLLVLRLDTTDFKNFW